MTQAATKLTDGFADLLLQQGMTGLFVAILLYAVYRLAKLYINAQEKRIMEAQTTTSALVTSSAALNRQSDILERNLQHKG